MPHAVVLMIGRDRILVETRSQVLRTAGYTVVTAFTQLQAIDELVRGDFDVVMLCHSIPVHGREHLASVLRQHNSHTPIVCVARVDGQFDGFAGVPLNQTDHLEIIEQMAGTAIGDVLPPGLLERFRITTSDRPSQVSS